MAVAIAPVAAVALAADIAETVIIQIVGQAVAAVIGSVLGPDLEALQEASYRFQIEGQAVTRYPGLALDPPAAVNAWIRGYLNEQEAKSELAARGLTPKSADVLYKAAGQPLPALTLMEAFRRGLIPFEDPDPSKLSVAQGILESDTKNKYIPLLQKLQYLLPDPGTVVEARLRGYINDADFAKWMGQLGYDEQVRGFIFKAAGTPISPQEGYAAFHRGLIPKTADSPDTPSLAQIFRESRINDKYLDVWMELQAYIPPPRTVTALLRAGSITEKTARLWFGWSGLPPEMIDAYVADASKQKSVATKQLAVGTVVQMYGAKELTRQQALDFITGRGYSLEDANFELDYADFKLVEAQVGALTTRIRTLYVGHKITKQTALDSLANVGMATEVINELIGVWDREAAASPALLTAVQIADAAAQAVIDPNAALAELQGRGYDARDAYIVLALHKVDMTNVPKPAGIL